MASTNITQMIADAAAAAGVDPQLAINVAVAESALNQNARSSAGAIGVFQLMPSTAASLGVDPTDLQQNITGGVTYLSQMLAMFNGDEASALAAYNWGPGNVATAQSKYGATWLSYAPAETQAYVSKILGGQQFTSTFAPLAPVAAAADSVLDSAQSFISNATSAAGGTLFGLSPQQFALLAGAGILAYFVLSELLD